MHQMTDPLRTTQWTSKENEDYKRWINGIKIMARIENGIPPTFRRHMWLILANRSIQLRKLDWQQIARFCLNEKSQPEDGQIDEQIVKVSVIFSEFNQIIM